MNTVMRSFNTTGFWTFSVKFFHNLTKPDLFGEKKNNKNPKKTPKGLMRLYQQQKWFGIVIYFWEHYIFCTAIEKLQLFSEKIGMYTRVCSRFLWVFFPCSLHVHQHYSVLWIFVLLKGSGLHRLWLSFLFRCTYHRT